jgi:hypothetical protein
LTVYQSDSQFFSLRSVDKHSFHSVILVVSCSIVRLYCIGLVLVIASNDLAIGLTPNTIRLVFTEVASAIQAPVRYFRLQTSEAGRGADRYQAKFLSPWW